MIRSRSRLITICLAVCTVALASDAFAVLGGDISTASRTRQSMPGASAKASRVQASNRRYSYEELDSEGIRIREYADANGKVFAVTWRGVAEPDLSVLLGQYFPDYKLEDGRVAPSRARAKNVVTNAIQVRRAGHMRDKHGLAYVPELVPVGVVAGDLE